MLAIVKGFFVSQIRCALDVLIRDPDWAPLGESGPSRGISSPIFFRRSPSPRVTGSTEHTARLPLLAYPTLSTAAPEIASFLSVFSASLALDKWIDVRLHVQRNFRRNVQKILAVSARIVRHAANRALLVKQVVAE